MRHFVAFVPHMPFGGVPGVGHILKNFNYFRGYIPRLRTCKLGSWVPSCAENLKVKFSLEHCPLNPSLTSSKSLHITPQDNLKLFSKSRNRIDT